MLLIGNFERIDDVDNYFEIVYEVISTKELKENYGENLSLYLYLSYEYNTGNPINLSLYDSIGGNEIHYLFTPEEENKILEMIKKTGLVEDVLAIESMRKTIIPHYEKAHEIHIVFDKKGNVKDFLVHTYGNDPERNILITAFISDELQDLRARHGNAFKVFLLDYLIENK